MSASLKFDGLKELMATLKISGQIAADGVRDTVRQSAEAFAEEARSNTKIGKTGNLRRGIKVKEKLDDTNVVSFEVRNTAPHAHLYEYGFMHKGGTHVPGKFVFARAGKTRRLMYAHIEQRLPAILQAAVDKS